MMDDEMSFEVFKMEQKYRVRYAPDSYCQWIAVAVLLASFGSFFGQTPINERKVGTFLISIATLILVWASPTYFISRWPVYNRWFLSILAFIVILLIVAFIWLALRIWIKF